MNKSITRRNFVKTGLAGAAVLPFLKSMPALASKSNTLVVVTGQTINSLDLHRKGTNRASYQVAVNCYDRLLYLMLFDLTPKLCLILMIILNFFSIFSNVVR